MICSYHVFSGTTRKLVVAGLDTDQNRIVSSFGYLWPNCKILRYSRDGMDAFFDQHEASVLADTVTGIVATKTGTVFKIITKPVTWAYDLDANPFNLSELEIQQFLDRDKAMANGETIPPALPDREIMVEDTGVIPDGSFAPLEIINVS